MSRGPKLHLKRLNAPKSWHLSKTKGIFAPRPISGTHPSSDCVPLLILVRNLLQLSNSAKESKLLLERGNIVINGKVRKDPKFPVGLFDVIFIPSLKISYRLSLNSTGFFKLLKYNDFNNKNDLLPQQKLKTTQNIEKNEKKTKNLLKNENENDFKLFLKVKNKGLGNKKMVGVNRAAENEKDKMISWVTTECGRILRYCDKDIKKGDSVIVNVKIKKINSFKKYQKFNFETEEEIFKILRMKEGSFVMVKKGKNKGRVGRIKFIEKHLKISDNVFVEDEMGGKFVCKKGDVIVVGEDRCMVEVDGCRGVRMSLEEKSKWSLRNLEGGKGGVEEVEVEG